MRPDVICFDMDGVLVDVSDSYRQAICDTVEHFTNLPVERTRIQDYKNRGGWNNDWALSHQLILDANSGTAPPYDQVVDYFQSIFFTGAGGLILKERWIAGKGLLERLSAQHRLSVFTGRPRPEAEFSLQRFAPGVTFWPIVTCDDVTCHKPLPEGLLRVRELLPGASLCYVGDTVDDARCASAAEVPFIGVASASSAWHAELKNLLHRENAVAVIDDINQLEEVLDTL
jgi:HAD superfamily phosphatase